MNITLEDILTDLSKSQENDAYYYDAHHDVGYHIHVDNQNKPTAFCKRNRRKVFAICVEEFINGVNSAYGNSISANSYYEI